MRSEEVALFEYIESGDFPETVQEHVVMNKIDLNDCYKESYTPLMVAAQNGCVNTARKLIELGANVNATTSDGDTALIEAAYNNQLEIMLLLIEKGVDVNFVDNDDYTALMWASSAGHSEACTLLLKAGADATVVSKQGDSAVDLALAGGYWNLARKLMSAGGKPERKKLKFKDIIRKRKPRTDGMEEHSLDEEEDEEALYMIREGEEDESSEDEDEEEDEEEYEEPEETWLTPILAECGTPADLIYLCEERLVRQEGFGCAQTLARTPPSLYHRTYLDSLGIQGLGLQQVLLDLHADLHHDYLQQKRQHGGTTKTQPHTTAAPQHQQTQPQPQPPQQQPFSTPAQATKTKGEHKHFKETSSATVPPPAESQQSAGKSTKKRAHQDSLQQLEGGGGESPTAGTGTASANTTPGSNKRQAVAVDYADG